VLISGLESCKEIMALIVPYRFPYLQEQKFRL